MTFCLNFYMNDNFEDFAGFLHCFFFKRNWQNLFIFFCEIKLVFGKHGCIYRLD